MESSSNHIPPDRAHFGFQQVVKQEKQGMVQGVFSRVAKHYDLMNDLMSFGLHRCWKQSLIDELIPQRDMVLLDVAGGTGDIAQRFIESGGGHATVCDLNQKMLGEGKKRLATWAYTSKIDWVHANAEQLPFADEAYDYYTISFGIRNVTNINKAIAEAYRVLRPGGKFVCLEFSNVSNKNIAKLYNFYSFQVIPRIGQIVAGDRDAYQYLVESIRQFPKASMFAEMLEDAGFIEVSFCKLTFGVVAIHVGHKPI